MGGLDHGVETGQETQAVQGARMELKTTMAWQMGSKIPTVEQMITTAEQMGLKLPMVEQMMQETTKMAQAGLE